MFMCKRRRLLSSSFPELTCPCISINSRDKDARDSLSMEHMEYGERVAGVFARLAPAQYTNTKDASRRIKVK